MSRLRVVLRDGLSAEDRRDTVAAILQLRGVKAVERVRQSAADCARELGFEDPSPEERAETLDRNLRGGL